MDDKQFKELGLNPPAPVNYLKTDIKKEYIDDAHSSRSGNRDSDRNITHDSGSLYCAPCKLTLNSEDSWYAHIIGRRHKKRTVSIGFFEGKKNPHVDSGNTRYIKTTGCPMLYQTRSLKTRAKMQPFFDKYKTTPMIGLMFVTEIWMHEEDEEPTYMCDLCGSECQKMAILNHVISFKHRLLYMKLFQMKIYDDVSRSSEKKSSAKDKVEDYARHLEERDGKGKMLVELVVRDGDEPPDSPRCYPELPRSADRIILNRVKELDASESLEFLTFALDSLTSVSDLSLDSVKTLSDLRDHGWEFYYEQLSKAVIGPRKGIALEYLLNQEYEKFMEEFFYMPKLPFGHNILPAVERELRARGIDKETLVLEV